MNPLSTVATIRLGGLEILPPSRGSEGIAGRHLEILTPEACELLAGLFRAFGPRRKELLVRRAERRRGREAGSLPGFLPETAAIRAGDWRVPPPPADLVDRRTEITGPVDRETAVRALTSGARCYMADLEDFTAPTWENLLDAQIHLRDAARRTLRFTDPAGEVYGLAGDLASLHVRPRGWHLSEKHVLFAGERVGAALFDFGLACFHTAAELRARGSGPYYYLPKLEGHLEARLWNDVFLHAQAALGLPAGTIRATAMIETLPAVFEAEEILHELGPHALGLNCGRWDYIFSAIKTLGSGGAPFPDRSRITMTVPFLRAYCRHVIEVCHRRGAYALGGMAAQVPIPDDPGADRSARELVRADKEREAREGFDGASVGHPSLVPIARAAFAGVVPGAARRSSGGSGESATRAELLDLPEGAITEDGVRLNLRVGVRYLEAWLGGQGCVVLDHRTEDVATAEISRAQLWQWLAREATLEDGRRITADLYGRLLAEEMARVEAEIGAERIRAGRFGEAIDLFLGMVAAPELAEFLTLEAYELLP